MKAPAFQQDGEQYLCVWRDDQLAIRVDRLRESSEGLYGEVTAYAVNETGVKANGGHLHWAKLNLSSTAARATFAKHMKSRIEDPCDCDEMLEYACVLTQRAFRTPEAAVNLATIPYEALRWCVYPFIPANDTTIFYGDGESCKSLVAALLCCSVMLQRAPISGVRPDMKGACLYYDYETTKEEVSSRVIRLTRGLKATAEIPDIIYRRMSRPLADETDTLRSDIATYRPVLLVVDSIAPACQGEMEKTAEPVLRFMNTLRRFDDLSKLVISHVSKADTEKRRARPYGSVFVSNMARSCWEVRSEVEENSESRHVGLFHFKANSGRRHPPIGLQFTFSPSLIACQALDVTRSVTLAHSASDDHRIREVLKQGEVDLHSLSQAVEVKENTLLRRLRRMNDVVQISGGRGKGHVSTWGLKSDRKSDHETLPF